MVSGQVGCPGCSALVLAAHVCVGELAAQDPFADGLEDRPAEVVVSLCVHALHGGVLASAGDVVASVCLPTEGAVVRAAQPVSHGELLVVECA